MTSIDDPRNVFYLPSSTSVDPQINRIFVNTGEFITLIAHNLSILGGIVTDTIEAETIGGPVTFNSDLNMQATKKITMNGVTVIDSNQNATFNRIDTETLYNINDPNPVMDLNRNFNINSLSINSTSIIDSSKNLDINTVAINGSQLVDSSKNISSNSVGTNSISISGNSFVDNTRTVYATNINGSALSISSSSAYIGGRRALVENLGSAGTGVIFGTIAANGAVLDGSPLDFTCSNIGTGLYMIYFQGAVGFGGTTPIVATFNDVGNWGFITVEHQGTANQVLVVIRNSAGVLTNYRFTFFANLFV